MILGDNIFYGVGLEELLCKSNDFIGGVVFVYWVVDFECYGVVEFDENGIVIFIEEKFVKFKFNYVVLGFYFYDN